MRWLAVGLVLLGLGLIAVVSVALWPTATPPTITPTAIRVPAGLGATVIFESQYGVWSLYDCAPIPMTHALPQASAAVPHIVYIGELRLDGTVFYLCETEPETNQAWATPGLQPSPTPRDITSVF